MAFLDATSGHARPDDILHHLAGGLGAHSALISRSEPGRAGVRSLARSSQRSFLAVEEALAMEVLGPLYHRMRSGTSCLASQHFMTTGTRDGAVSELLRERGLADVGLVVLDCSSNAADYLEFHFVTHADDDVSERLEELSGVLSRIWKLTSKQLDFETRRPATLARYIKSTAKKHSILDEGNPAQLTRAEFRICLMLSRGLSASAMAKELNVSMTTVRTHLRRIYSKTDVSGLSELSYRLTASAERISESLSAQLIA